MIVKGFESPRFVSRPAVVAAVISQAAKDA
jgi:hypothetical protein